MWYKGVLSVMSRVLMVNHEVQTIVTTKVTVD